MTPDTDTDTAAKRIGRFSPTGRRLVPIALAVLVIASTVGVGLLGWQSIRAGDAEQNGVAALDAARTRMSVAFSYDSKTLDADLARGREQLTGNFAAQFEQTASKVIVPASRQQAIASTAEVSRAALMNAQEDRAEVLVYLIQTTSTASQPTPQRGVVQIKVTMTRTADNQWLISEVQPL